MSDAVQETEPTLPAAVTRLAFPRERIFHVRALRGMSSSQLAEESGLTTRDVERIEQSSPDGVTLREILDIAMGLDVHPAWLAFGVGEMGPYPFDRRAAWPEPPVPPGPGSISTPSGSSVNLVA